MFTAEVKETKIEIDGKKHTHITICVVLRARPLGCVQKHVGVYSGPDDEVAAQIREDLGLKNV